MSSQNGLSRRQKSWITVAVVGLWVLVSLAVLASGGLAVYQLAIGAEPTAGLVFLAMLLGWVMHSVVSTIYFTTMPGLAGEPA